MPLILLLMKAVNLDFILLEANPVATVTNSRYVGLHSIYRIVRLDGDPSSVKHHQETVLFSLKELRYVDETTTKFGAYVPRETRLSIV
ncbi:hypothetical protein PsorP6_015575 [Peronosclerospora sorghi]|uniref:Uncharacterized protein n=1 Tax=Peronosclerospora sorghi TaxID=230839 RepID=A0ACC0WQ27_9STRA|nr:hypothetical protein PsorP6_015575 [Peronosclerospora sorghi]